MTLSEELQARLHPIRERWSPERARGNPAHVTIVYHDEAPDAEMLEERLRTVARDLAPFPLFVGSPERFREPARGAFLRVSDPTDAIARIRHRVLRPPFVARQRFDLHVTILHPDQGARLERAWPEISRVPSRGSFEVSALQLVGSGNTRQAEIELTGD